MDTSPLAEWLLGEMRIRGLSQSDLSRLSGLTRQTVSYYITGKSKQPDPAALKKIAEVFQIPPEEIYRIAGIPLSELKENRLITQIAYLTSNLPETDQKEVLEFVKLRRRLAEEREKYATKRTDKKPSTTK